MRFIETYWWLWLFLGTLPVIGFLGYAYLDLLFIKLNFVFGRRVLATIFLFMVIPPKLVAIPMTIFFYLSWLFIPMIILIKIIRYATH